ncbi:MAG TPA: Na+:solute symporter, partial [Gemmatimonadaceae bacterium]
LTTVGVTTVIWISTALLTPPVDEATLVSFVKLVKPAGPGWNPIRKLAGEVGSPDSLPQAMLGWVLGCAFVYAALFGTGSFLYGRMTQFWMWLAVFVVSGLGMLKVLRGFWATRA